MASRFARWNRRVARHFTLGGTLSIVNCFFWMCFAAGADELPRWAITAMLPLLLCLSLPILFPFMLLMNGGDDNVVLVLFVFITGVNALLWGHGLAWIIRSLGRRFGWFRAPQNSAQE